MCTGCPQDIRSVTSNAAVCLSTEKVATAEAAAVKKKTAQNWRKKKKTKQKKKKKQQKEDDNDDNDSIGTENEMKESSNTVITSNNIDIDTNTDMDTEEEAEEAEIREKEITRLKVALVNINNHIIKTQRKIDNNPVGAALHKKIW